MGSNGLANPRDFLTPEAWFEDRKVEITAKGGSQRGGFLVIHKFLGKLFAARQAFSPFNVVAWHGNYAPYKAPRLPTLLCSPPVDGGGAHVPAPYYHRNTMSEFMGLIRGVYEGKADGFQPGGASLHSCYTPHGPDTATFEKAVADKADAFPGHLPEDTLAFMFETCFVPRLTPAAMASPMRDLDYYHCWEGLKSHFGIHKGLNEGEGEEVGEGGGGDKEGEDESLEVSSIKRARRAFSTAHQ
eukprot:jgi/Mesvir1/11202/Mv16595-RA.1